mgnify:CR=1 FL=1
MIKEAKLNIRKKVYIIFFILIFSGNIFLYSATISGFIKNKDNGEPVIYCSVFIEDSEYGTITNKKGFFALNEIPVGKHNIFISKMGFKAEKKEIFINKYTDSKFFEIEIATQSVKIDTLSVREKKFDSMIDINPPKIAVSKLRADMDEMDDIPQVIEPDIFRAMQKLPGVTSISDFSSGLYVRGGSQDQNLILLDEIDVYNPTHFGGVFSTFNTDAVENVELLKGGFPAKYGGRLSSVLNVTNRQGNRKYFEGTARTSLLSSSATIEGPWHLGKQSGSYMASFRRTYLELLKSFIDIPDYYFYDGHAKFNWDINPKNKMMNSVYFGKDNLEMDLGYKLLMEWGNETVTNQWVHIFNSSLFSHFIIAGSHFNSNFEFENNDDKFYRTNDIYDLTLKSLFSYRYKNSHLLEFGLENKYNNIGYLIEMKNTDVDESSLPDVDVDSNIISAFIQDDWRINALWNIQFGARVNYFVSRGKNLPAVPDADYFRFSPRLSIRYNVTEESNIYYNMGRYYQFLTSINMGVNSPMDLWFPLDGSVKPGISNHFICGYKGQLTSYYGFDISTYYKNYDNLLTYRSETDYEWDNETSNLSDVYNDGIGYSYGTDFILRNDWRGIKGFISYGYGITKRKIDNININPETDEEEYFYPKYDKTHQVNIVESINISEMFNKYPLGADTKFSLTYAFSTGQPYSKPEKIYFDGSDIEFFYGYKDSDRVSNYSRLDIGFKFKWYLKHYDIEPYFQIINLLNHENVYTINFEYEVEENEQNEPIIRLVEDETTMFPFIPFIGINVEW